MLGYKFMCFRCKGPLLRGHMRCCIHRLGGKNFKIIFKQVKSRGKKSPRIKLNETHSLFFFAAESEGYCLRLTNINMDCWPGGASGQKLAEIYPNSLPKGFSKPLQN